MHTFIAPQFAATVHPAFATTDYQPDWQTFHMLGNQLSTTLPTGTDFFAASLPADEWPRVQHRVVVVQTPTGSVVGRVLANELAATGLLTLCDDAGQTFRSVAQADLQALWLAERLTQRTPIR